MSGRPHLIMQQVAKHREGCPSRNGGPPCRCEGSRRLEPWRSMTPVA
ncbi:hypothetical protein B005_2017 [Nocardiopsis alba ATCC BAA-2165]|uniref:Uncharacterized protein n=1 Tax=Nocardiopsis alba (strain ATCC BAA-2165 / BE74) TaxID=1205910 RepID=J7L9Y0_NOCAA|nr:hypothetical protein B005_2017 [Nocardiopsis alba ATCC BAA-2165]